jgi:ATP-dependent RNA helicase DDX58
MTPQILVDAIKMNSVSLSQFTLLLFDECHHANKDEPYNVIMGLYLDEKLSGNTTNLPQVRVV